MSQEIVEIGGSKAVSSALSCTDTPQVITDFNIDLLSILVQNLGPDVAYIGASNVTETTGIAIGSGGSITINTSSRGAWSCVCSSGEAADLRIVKESK